MLRRYHDHIGNGRRKIRVLGFKYKVLFNRAFIGRPTGGGVILFLRRSTTNFCVIFHIIKNDTKAV